MTGDYTPHNKNLSKEWAYWRKYYRDKGCSWNKIEKLTFKKMRKYGVGGH